MSLQLPNVQEIKALLMQALGRLSCGEDLRRCRSTFHHYTASQMREEYGQSGQTPAQILESYESHEAKVRAAAAWVAAQGLAEAADVQEVLRLAHAYADAKLMRYGFPPAKDRQPLDPDAAFQALQQAVERLAAAEQGAG
jgi:hypothetical protein